MMFGKIGVLVSAALIATAAPTAASAALVTFDFTGGNTSTWGSVGNTMTFTQAGLSVTVSAWSKSGSTVNAAYLGRYDKGLGVTNGVNDDSHTVDNSGNYDFLVFKFNQTVEAESAIFAAFGDTDASIGVGNAASYSITNWASVQSLFGTFEDNSGTSSGGSRAINITNEQGNLLFVGAGLGNVGNNDYFKLSKLTVNTVAPPAVPEPATWAMMIAGFGLVGASLRRRAGKPVLA